MKNIDLIEILYDEIIQTEADSENYERIVGEANKALAEKVINPLYKKDFKRGSETEGIISHSREREGRFYFELGFKCAMQLRNIGEIEGRADTV